MKLREFNFNSLKNPFTPTTLCVKDGGKSYEGLSIGNTLRMLPVTLADREIKEKLLNCRENRKTVNLDVW